MTTVTELEIEFLKSKTGLSSSNYSDLKLAYFRQLTGLTTGSLADVMVSYYRSLGFSGSISDMEMAFWRSKGATGETYNDLRLAYFLAPEPPPAGGLITDSFNRVDSLVTLGNTDTGQAWSADRGTWGINLNRAALILSVVNPNIATVEIPETDYSIETSLVAGDGGLVFRYVDLNNYWFLRINSGGVSRLFEVSGGVSTVMGSGDSGILGRVECVGSNINWFIGGIQQNGAAVNDAVVSGNRVGLHAASDTVRIDDFRVEW